MKFNLKSSQIYAMDETPVLQDIVGTTTISKKGSQMLYLNQLARADSKVLNAKSDS